MKKVLLIFTVLLTSLLSCTEEGDTYLTEEIFILNEPDIKAYKLEQVAPLFDGIARQPEMAEGLINAAEVMLYDNFTDLLPISDTLVAERGSARGFAFSSMFDAMARQPESIPIIDSVATKFLGVHDDSYINDEMLAYTKVFASRGLLDGLARQPENYDKLDPICLKYFNCNLEELLK